MKRIWMLGLGGLELVALASSRSTFLKMSCSQLVLDRIDPYLAPAPRPLCVANE
jgi:hypothetical protein